MLTNAKAKGALRSEAQRLINAYERACLQYAALIEELRAAAHDVPEFEMKLAEAAVAREKCSVARARISSYLVRGPGRRYCRIYR